ncbi:MAG TPA: hypothetical protein PKW71_12565, partial [Anaerohalosphaeraceae bacterium]|nr:hypothetical protein [Anaerohalosphaeraceae bacterium]HRV18947.1 hypothetical protein [Anaerohalosphaeraceae bacterium]
MKSPLKPRIRFLRLCFATAKRTLNIQRKPNGSCGQFLFQDYRPPPARKGLSLPVPSETCEYLRLWIF